MCCSRATIVHRVLLCIVTDMQRSLSEWIHVVGDDNEAGPSVPHDDLAHDNAVAEWSGLPYAELSVILVHLQYLAMLHQTHHWVARGDSFYGDHQLFQLLYQRTIEDIDDVAEKAVGYGNEQNVSLAQQLSQLSRLSRCSGSSQTIPQSSGLAHASLEAECSFLRVLKSMRESLRSQYVLTDGMDNLLPQIADRHEKHVYLLRRRCTVATMGL